MLLHTHIIASVSLGILLLVPVSAHAQQVEPKGELHIYPRATQIGVVANREFKNEQGRIVKIIYYTYAALPTNNVREESLREHSSRTYEYDEHGCPFKSESYDQLRNLTHIEEVRCRKGTATPALTTVRNTQGIKQRESRHTDTGSTETTLEFDSTGEKVIGITGALPSDTDLVHGWGNVVHGLAVGIAADREKGRQQDLNVCVSVKNVDNDAGVVMVSPILMELKDADGQVIQENSQQTEPNQVRRPNECPAYLQFGAPRAGRAQIQYTFSLGERYKPLPPGKYSLTLRYCVSEMPDRLVSNTIQFEVN